MALHIAGQCSYACAFRLSSFCSFHRYAGHTIEVILCVMYSWMMKILSIGTKLRHTWKPPMSLKLLGIYTNPMPQHQGDKSPLRDLHRYKLIQDLLPALTPSELALLLEWIIFNMSQAFKCKICPSGISGSLLTMVDAKYPTHSTSSRSNCRLAREVLILWRTYNPEWKALKLKLCWSLHHSEALWARFLLAKYCDNLSFAAARHKPGCSKNWHEMLEIRS